MTAAPPTDDAAGGWTGTAMTDDGACAAFAPPMPAARSRGVNPARPTRERGPAAPRRVAQSDRRDDRPAPPRPPSRLAEVFADEDAPPPTPVPPAPAPPPPAPSAAVAVRVRPAPAVLFEEADGDEAEPFLPPPAPAWLGVTRGVAAALAAGALGAAFLGTGGGLVPNVAPLPAGWAGPLWAFVGTGLALFAARGPLPGPARWGAFAAAGLLAGFAAKEAVSFARADGLGPSLPLQLFACAATVAAAVRLAPPAAAPAGGAGWVAAVAGLAACGVGFPLADGALEELPPADRTPAAVAGAVAGWWAPAGSGAAD